MYKDLFLQAGLSSNEALVYEYLLKNGQVAAFDITKNTPLNKGVVYLALGELVKKGLVLEKMLKPKNPNVRNKKRISYFTPEHPNKLKDYLDNQEFNLQKAKKNLEANFDGIVSSFNLISGKPGVSYHEGMKGVEKVTMDSLDTKEEIYTYVDAEAVMNNIPDINNAYIKKRNELGITKKMILPDSAFTKKFLQDYHREVTDIKLIDHKKFPFTSLMQIYSGKVSYVNFTAHHKIGIIIEDQAIYQMHRNLFEFTWKFAKSLDD